MNDNNLEILETGLIITAAFFGGELGGDIGVFVQIAAGSLALYKMIEITRNWILNSKKEKRELRKEEREQERHEKEQERRKEEQERRKEEQERRKEEQEEHAIKMKKHKLELKQLEQKINKEK